jgi:hypothetical protein
MIEVIVIRSIQTEFEETTMDTLSKLMEELYVEI